MTLALQRRALYIRLAMADTHDIRLKRLKFRSWHRGFVEADLILGGFVDRYARDLPPEQLDVLEHLLDQPDHDIYGWIVERGPTPPEFDTEIMLMIRRFCDEAHATIGGSRGG